MTQASDTARAYSRANGDRFLQELFEMLRIPSLSGDPAHAGDIRRMAEWLTKHLSGLGLDKVEIMETAGHPVVYGEWLGAGPDKPTVLVYGHYDVVPAEMADGWHSDPFEPVVKDGKQQADTVNTIRALRAIGVPAAKILVLINKVETDDDLRTDFAGVFGFCASGEATIPEGGVIFANELFAMLKTQQLSIGALNDDATDYYSLSGEWARSWSETAKVYVRAGASFVDSSPVTGGGNSSSSSGFSGGVGAEWTYQVTRLFADLNQYLDPNSDGRLVNRTQLRLGVARDLSQTTVLTFGLRGIQERLDLVRGQLTLQSTPRKGTVLSVVVPRAASILNDEPPEEKP